MKKIARRAGLTFWFAAISVLGWAWLSQPERLRPIVARLQDSLLPDRRLSVRYGNQDLRPNDPIFCMGDGQYRQIGIVHRVDPDLAILRLQRNAIPTDQIASINFHTAGTSFGTTLNLMMPPAVQQEVRGILLDWTRQHGRDVASSMVPILQRSLSESLPIIQSAAERSMRDHSSDVSAMVARWKKGVVDESLVPLAQQQMLPIIRRHAAGPAESIGRDLWDRASLWGFAWRALYDKSGLPKQDLVADEWQRFVDEEAVPVFESYAPEIAEATQRILIEAAGNQIIRDELAEVARTVAADRKTQALVRTILKEALVQNRELQAVWSEALTAADTQQAFAEAGRRIEPMVRRIGDTLLGTRESGISPGFARVLRNQILGRDRRWLVIHLDPTRSTPNLLVGDWITNQPYPVIRLIDL